MGVEGQIQQTTKAGDRGGRGLAGVPPSVPV